VTDIQVREIALDEASQGAAVLGRGMRDNPLHVAAFGADAGHRERALSRMFVPVMRGQIQKGTVLGAFAAGQMVGVCGLATPGNCSLSVLEKVIVFPGLVRAVGLRGTTRVLTWVNAWARRDPALPHWHLGPVGVERELQGQGIGSALMGEFCRRVDVSQSAAYLETDKAENVPFYERFGFAVVAAQDVLGARNWFMQR
jgi:GNAT superfamily N-acetyltransferase